MAKCTFCKSTEHSQFYCKLKPRKPIQVKARMKPIGRVGRETAKAAARWRKEQQPNHQGYYQCYIGGEYIQEFSAEHPYSKARHPELRTTQKLEIVCDPHNALKGSLGIDEFLEKYPEFKLTVKKEYLKEN